MRIGVDITAVAKTPRTGVEEYVCRLITHILALNSARPVRSFARANRASLQDLGEAASNGARDHEFFLFSCENEEVVSRSLGRMPKNAQVVCAPYRTAWHQIILPGLARKIKPDIFFSPSQFLPLNWPSIGIPGVVTIHGVEWERCPWAYSFLQRHCMRWAARQTTQNAKGIIAVSEHTRTGIEKFFSTKTPIKVIHHGSQSAVDYKRREGGRERRILFIGRKDKRKNIRGIVEAFHLLRHQVSTPFIFSIVGPRGNDPFAARLQSRRFNHAAIENINRFISEQEKDRIYQDTNILLLPSFDEGFGMPILEAQSRGIPVVSSSFLREIGGKGAVYCDPVNSASIAESLLQLMSDESFYKNTQNRARENAARFSWEKCASDTLEFIEYIVYANR